MKRCQEAWRALTWFKLVVPVQHLLPAVRSLLHQDVLSCHGIVVPQTHVRPASVAHTLPTLSQQQQQGPVSHTSQHTLPTLYKQQQGPVTQYNTPYPLCKNNNNKILSATQHNASYLHCHNSNNNNKILSATQQAHLTYIVTTATKRSCQSHITTHCPLCNNNNKVLSVTHHNTLPTL